MERCRLRALGITTGTLPTGQWNTITDVPGISVGFTTLLRDDGAAIRTGVTAIWPRPPGETWTDAVMAGAHSFNGNGELTGLLWIAEQGLLAGPVCITNTHSVGVVRDAICARAIADGVPVAWLLPVVGETFDGWLNEVGAFPITREHVFAALDAAAPGPVAEGNVGGGTGMICHEFKGGTGTASRVVRVNGTEHVVGALVQANYGTRDLFRIDGVPVGREIGLDEVPSPRVTRAETGSIIVILATDAPLLPIQCQRLARRATTGLAWVGGIGGNGSGDIFLAFSTGNHAHFGEPVSTLRMLAPELMTELFRAAAEATEEAILNALCMAETMTGQHGRIAHALPLDRVQAIMRRHGRIAA
jgi:D-aminopeptidase